MFKKQEPKSTVAFEDKDRKVENDTETLNKDSSIKENKETEEKEENKENLLKEENEKLKDQLMRALAELDNTRRRSLEEKEKTAKYAISRFAEDLIPVMENFYLALDSVKDHDFSKDKNAKTFFDGVKLTQNELKKVFDKNGLIRLFPINEEFNPNMHNAIAQIESDGEEGKVVQVMQAGYKIKERLLRPALVGVSKKA